MKLDAKDIGIRGYTPVREIGEGFFSDVWLVKNIATGNERAAKIVTDERYTQLLKQEGRITEKLSHPNIVTIYDIITEVERPYILMEHVDGQDLKQRLLNGRKIGEKGIEKIVRNTIAGVEYAHSQGVLHCDIKPANILLGKNAVKISDFNVGLIVAEIGKEIAAGSDYDPLEDTLPWKMDFTGYPADKKTISFLRGTWAYMAPEVQRGAQPTEKSDQYSIGIIIQEMLAHG